MGVITISREFLTESDKVAARVAKKLGWEYVGKELLAKIAREMKISESEAELFHQDSRSRILRFVDRYTCSLVQKVVDRERGCLDDEAYFETTKKLVEDLYEADNSVILGWGSQCILRDKPNTLHVRLTKKEELKIKDTMKHYSLDRAAAKDYIQTEESDSRSYIKHYFNEDWNDARLYDLIIDMGKVSVEEAAEMIIENLKRKTK